jgi:putative transcriptional regulator
MESSLKGQLLLASSLLVDPNFIKTVILMVQHDENGAVGLVLNRPLQMTIAEAFKQISEESYPIEGMLHQGGPCEGPLMVLHTQADAGESQVLDSVFLTTEKSKIEWLMNNNQGPILFFVGYSGWGAGQLEREMESGSWLTMPADAATIFSEDEQQWSKLTTRLTLGRWIDPNQMPEDPSMN